MVKPATVERAQATRHREHRLRLVKSDAAMISKKAVGKPEPKRPEIADDLDDMWDNVPV